MTHLKETSSAVNSPAVSGNAPSAHNNSDRVSKRLVTQSKNDSDGQVLSRDLLRRPLKPSQSPCVASQNPAFMSLGSSKISDLVEKAKAANDALGGNSEKELMDAHIKAWNAWKGRCEGARQTNVVRLEKTIKVSINEAIKIWKVCETIQRGTIARKIVEAFQKEIEINGSALGITKPPYLKTIKDCLEEYEPKAAKRPGRPKNNQYSITIDLSDVD